jgi:thiosulfate dehydrogenase (quinone) large subunit
MSVGRNPAVGKLKSCDSVQSVMAAPVQVTRPALYALALLRLTLGLIFLWAFLDKTFGLEYSTKPGNSWLDGGHPTQGYLGSSYGPLEGLFHAMAGNAVVDVLFMFGLLAVGLSLTLGFATRLGGWAGFAMVLLMYASHPIPWAPANGTHPFIDDHVTEAAAMALIALTNSGDWLGIGRWWLSKTAKWPALQ